MRSMPMALMLLIYCFMYLSLFVGFFVSLCFGMHYFMSFLFFSNHLDEEERAGCFALIVFWMSCYCKCSVPLPHGAVGWSAVCDCGIS